MDAMAKAARWRIEKKWRNNNGSAQRSSSSMASTAHRAAHNAAPASKITRIVRWRGTPGFASARCCAWFHCCTLWYASVMRVCFAICEIHYICVASCARGGRRVMGAHERLACRRWRDRIAYSSLQTAQRRQNKRPLWRQQHNVSDGGVAAAQRGKNAAAGQRRVIDAASLPLFLSSVS